MFHLYHKTCQILTLIKHTLHLKTHISHNICLKCHFTFFIMNIF